jgi:hypothetical protein
MPLADNAIATGPNPTPVLMTTAGRQGMETTIASDLVFHTTRAAIKTMESVRAAFTTMPALQFPVWIDAQIAGLKAISTAVPPLPVQAARPRKKAKATKRKAPKAKAKSKAAPIAAAGSKTNGTTRKSTRRKAPASVGENAQPAA